MGASRALHESVAFDTRRVTSLDWVSYPIMRFKDAPAVRVAIVPAARPRADRLGRAVAGADRGRDRERLLRRDRRAHPRGADDAGARARRARRRGGERRVVRRTRPGRSPDASVAARGRIWCQRPGGLRDEARCVSESRRPRRCSRWRSPPARRSAHHPRRRRPRRATSSSSRSAWRSRCGRRRRCGPSTRRRVR